MDSEKALSFAPKSKIYSIENQLISIKKNQKTQYLKKSYTFATQTRALWQRI